MRQRTTMLDVYCTKGRGFWIYFQWEGWGRGVGEATLQYCFASLLKMKMVSSKRQTFALLGGKILLFRVDPSSEATWRAEKQRRHKNWLPCKIGRKSTKCTQTP